MTTFIVTTLLFAIGVVIAVMRELAGEYVAGLGFLTVISAIALIMTR